MSIKVNKPAEENREDAVRLLQVVPSGRMRGDENKTETQELPSEGMKTLLLRERVTAGPCYLEPGDLQTPLTQLGTALGSSA